MIVNSINLYQRSITVYGLQQEIFDNIYIFSAYVGG